MVVVVAEVENFVVLKPGRPVRMHFRAHKVVDRVITDPTFGVTRTVKSLLFLVDEQDGAPVDKTFSVLSQKLAGELSGYLEENRYLRYDFTLVKDAAGTVPPRIVEVTPR